MQDQSLEIRSGGGVFYTVFGLPILLSGIWMIYAGFQGAFEAEGAAIESPLIYVPFGGVWVAGGAAMLLGRAGKRLDPRRRQLIDWWGLVFFPFRQTSRDWDEFNQVVLRKEIIAGNTIKTVYRVCLEGTGKPGRMDAFDTFLECRRQGEKIAHCIKLPLHDLASDSHTVRQPDELDVSLRDQLLKGGRKLELSAPPTDARLSYKMDDQRAVFEWPRSGFQTRDIRRMAVSTLLTFPVLFLLARTTVGASFSDKAMGFGLLSLYGLVYLIGTFYFIKDSLSSHRLTLNREFLQFDSRSPLGGSVKKIPLDQLEELELGRSWDGVWGWGGQCLEARSDHENIKIGAGLRGQEMSWLKNIIEYILVTM